MLAVWETLWDWWLQPFISHGLLRDALYACILTVISTSLVGCWVTIRGISFFAETLGHGILPGVAVAALVGGSILLGAAASAVAMIALMFIVRRYSPLPNDIVIGLLFVGTLALAVLLLSRSQDVFIEQFLFGSVWGISQAELLQQAIVAGVILVLVVLFYRPLMVASYNADVSALLGFNPRLVELGLLGMLTLAVVASFRVVGSLLVFAFLIAPPATAALLSKRVSTMMALSVGFGMLAVFLGILFDYHWGVAASAAMALSATGIFFISLLTAALWRGSTQNRTAKRMSQNPLAARIEL